jgi:hypothetical protein
VLEFGSGSSTLWWGKRAKEVVAFEASPVWYEKTRRLAPANVTIHLVTDRRPPPDHPAFAPASFDIVIDGMDRPHCAKLTLGLLAPGGAIVVDNSHGYGFDGYPSLVAETPDPAIPV